MKKILIIDDDISVGEVLKDFLDELGYRTFYAADAKNGIIIAERERPDLILLDVLMPQIGGLEALKRIKEILPDVIVVVMSGLQDEQVAKQAIRRGAYDYITKPFDLIYVQSNLLARIFPEEV